MRSYSGPVEYTKRKRSSNEEDLTDGIVGGNAGKIPKSDFKIYKKGNI